MAPLLYAAKFDPFPSLDCATPWRNPRKGRDQLLPSGNLAAAEAASTAATPEVVKKKRGRPRKNPPNVNKSDEVMSQDVGKNQDEGSLTNGDVSEPLVKRRAVGRPKKGTSSDAESRDREQVRGAMDLFRSQGGANYENMTRGRNCSIHVIRIRPGWSSESFGATF